MPNGQVMASTTVTKLWARMLGNEFQYISFPKTDLPVDVSMVKASS